MFGRLAAQSTLARSSKIDLHPVCDGCRQMRVWFFLSSFVFFSSNLMRVLLGCLEPGIGAANGLGRIQRGKKTSGLFFFFIKILDRGKRFHLIFFLELRLPPVLRPTHLRGWCGPNLHVRVPSPRAVSLVGWQTTMTTKTIFLANVAHVKILLHRHVRWPHRRVPFRLRVRLPHRQVSKDA